MTFAFAVAAGALTIWLVVRIANRRERWPKWTFGALALLFAYPFSFGPACWLTSRGLLPESAGIIYKPLLYLMADVRFCFSTTFFPRPGWRQLIAWGELHDGTPWHRSNFPGDRCRDTIADKWARRYARNITPPFVPVPQQPVIEPDDGMPQRVIAEFSDGTEAVLAEWLSRADANEIRAMAYLSEDGQLVDVRIEPTLDAFEDAAESDGIPSPAVGRKQEDCTKSKGEK